MEPGDYTLALQPIEGYTTPEAQTVTVKEKVVYKADVQAVKEKIVQASQVNESAEDSGVSNAGSAPIVEEVTDTVTYAESDKTETGTKTTYTAKLSSSGHLLLADGKSRKVEAPKRKKQKHVRFIAESCGPVAEKIRSKEKITNSELRKAIAAIRGSDQDQEG